MFGDSELILFLFVGVMNQEFEFSTWLLLNSARSSLLSDMMCSLLLLLFGNVVGAEDNAVDDDGDGCLFNIGDGE